MLAGARYRCGRRGCCAVAGVRRTTKNLSWPTGLGAIVQAKAHLAGLAEKRPGRSLVIASV